MPRNKNKTIEKWCPIKFPYSLSIYQFVVYLCWPIKTSMVSRRMFQMVFADKTPKNKVSNAWGRVKRPTCRGYL